MHRKRGFTETAKNVGSYTLDHYPDNLEEIKNLNSRNNLTQLQVNPSCLNMNSLKTGKQTLLHKHPFFLGLRHVSDDQKTHKNPSLRAQGPSVRSPTKSHTPSPTSPKNSPQQSHAPVLELEGKKWRVVSSSHPLNCSLHVANRVEHWNDLQEALHNLGATSQSCS